MLCDTVAESSGTTVTTSQSYCAYGRKRTTSGGNTNCSSSNSLVTDHTFTGQKYDSSGLQFFNARYYDPQIGTFISPDTIVPDASLVVDYNRYVYARGNALKFSDPTGHDPWWMEGRTLSSFYAGDVRDLIANYYNGGSATMPANDIGPLGQGKAPDGVSIYLSTPLSKLNFQGKGAAGGVELLRNTHTGKFTAFAVMGGQVSGGTSFTPVVANFVYNIGEDNLAYKGPFLSFIGVAQLA